MTDQKETGIAPVKFNMDDVDPEQHVASLAAELLRRERPALTFDELERVDRRLNTFCAPRRAPRPGSRLVVAICLAFGLLFMTAGTGLAISGFATPGAADQAQYPDRTAGGPPASAEGTAASPQRAQGRHSSPSSLGEIRAGSTSTVEVSLRQAETHNDLPFTGFDAIPILVAGIALIVIGAAINRRTRGSQGP
jgi:hypothetical protein